MKDLLGGKGANLAEMTNMGLPVPHGFTISTEACLAYLDAGGGRVPGRPGGRGRDPRADARVLHGQAARRSQRPVAGQRPVRRQVLDARHDGHRPEPGPQRGVAEGAGRAVGRRHAVRARRLPPVHPDVRQDRDGRAGRRLRGSARSREGRQGRGRLRHRPRRRRPGGAGDGVPGHLPPAHRPGVPDGPARADAPGDRSGLQELERPARDRLPAPEQDQRLARHRGERAVDGVRQPRRRFRHGRGVHARPQHRREGALRRLPGQRAGRGRRGGHPQHAAARRPGDGRRRRPTPACAR